MKPLMPVIRVIVAGALMFLTGTSAAKGTELRISGASFALDGRPTFLQGVSYYGALGASDDFIRRDLVDLQAYGFNWIRVWATWAAFANDVSAVAPDGTGREPFLGKLDWLVGECDRRGMVVDVTLSRGNGITGPNRLQAMAAHQQAVETLVARLRSHRNWYLDLANERNIRDQRFVEIDELRRLRDAAKQLDPDRLITASHAGGDISRADVEKYLFEARLDFIAPHRPRDRGSAGQTAANAREILGWMRDLGRIVPVHYQEPFRRGYGGWQPSPEDFSTDLDGARAGGAAGWCFHNGDARGLPEGEPRRSFDMRRRRLFDQFDDAERAFLAALLRVRSAMSEGVGSEQAGKHLRATFSPPSEYANDLGNFRSLLVFDDGRSVISPADWTVRRREIEKYWRRVIGPWPPRMEAAPMEVLRSERRERFTQKRVRVAIAPGRTAEGWLLVPDGAGPFPAVLVPFYEPETSIGLGKPLRDFALQLTRRGFVTLSIGSPGGDAWKPDLGEAKCQALAYLAVVAASCAEAMASLPDVDPRRLGVVGHSYGGKWALFAGALCDRFAAVAVSDPGIVWDETRPNVNYWEPWYLGRDPDRIRNPGVVTPENPRTGAYKELFESHRDLHELLALITPRPFLLSGGSEDSPERWRALNHIVLVNRVLGVTNHVAMTSRSTHDPTLESNEQLYAFFEVFLKGPGEP